MSDDKHSVKSHYWRAGKLIVAEHFFETFVAALEYSRQTGAHTSKIYAATGELVHSASSTAPAVEQTYA